MNPGNPGHFKTVAILALLLAPVCSPSAALIDPAQVKEIATTLPDRPAGFGQPISNRDAWARLAALPPFQKVIGEAQTKAHEAMPESPDDLYLDFSKTGNR